jgi:hypothetical protein
MKKYFPQSHKGNKEPSIERKEEKKMMIQFSVVQSISAPGGI